MFLQRKGESVVFCVKIHKPLFPIPYPLPAHLPSLTNHPHLSSCISLTQYHQSQPHRQSHHATLNIIKTYRVSTLHASEQRTSSRTADRMAFDLYWSEGLREEREREEMGEVMWYLR